MTKQILLKVVLITQTITVGLLTVIAFKNEGTNLFSIFIANIQAMNWNGQFNLDFSSYLILSGLWIAWRSKFSTSSIIFAILSAILGIIVFAPYLLYLLKKENGDLKKLLIGDK